MALRSWIASANDPATDFPIQNLPYGVFCHRQQTRIGVAIGNQILDLHACADQGLLQGLPDELVKACCEKRLNTLMSLGPQSWSGLRSKVTALLNADAADSQTRDRVEPLLIAMNEDRKSTR